ncbi:polysaccharide deacetylase family protein [Natronomonas marina]|jgi:peptidoglycan/xylan/chitin deacetylase (PgdA/CDA1 family)|uniref:polysaccharide deacetylase family protein n=1 Tax=Natronomonas marina TaxID=2961939 RepID=UPI0020C9AA0A|nr:polysaccharide deacetylase family protein [Natronomonas marina]
MTSSGPGSVVISLDAELAWGVHDRQPSAAEERRIETARRSWSWLVDLFDEHGVPATWAVVGALLAESADDAAPEHPLSDAWFETARRGIARRPDEWLGRDLVAAVADADADHELASHSFSHPVFADVSRSVADAECRLSRVYGRRLGLEFSSFVFPRNRIGHRDVLAEHGYRCYRGRRPYRLPAVPGVRGAATLAGTLTGTGSPPVVSPRVDEYGLVELPASLFLGGFRDRPWRTVASVGTDPAVGLAKRGVERARREGGVFHLWLHPNDLTDDAYARRVAAVVSHVADRREETDLRVETMDGLARRALADREVPVP